MQGGRRRHGYVIGDIHKCRGEEVVWFDYETKLVCGEGDGGMIKQRKNCHAYSNITTLLKRRMPFIFYSQSSCYSRDLFLH